MTAKTLPPKDTKTATVEKIAREKWRVSANGRVIVTSTSGTSAAVLDEAVVKYHRALKRLADR